MFVCDLLSSNPVHGEVYSIQHFRIKLVSDLRQVSGFLQALRFPSTIKTDRHDITEILLKVTLNTINLNLSLFQLTIISNTLQCHMGRPFNFSGGVC